MRVEPSKNNIFAKAIKGEEQTKSGFLLSDKSIEETQIAEVIATGREVIDYLPGNKIIYKPYTITDIRLEDEGYFMIEESDVLGKVINE